MTHFRYEILRTLRNRVFYAITLVLPLALFYGLASGQRHGTFDGTAFPLACAGVDRHRRVDRRADTGRRAGLPSRHEPGMRRA